MQVVDSIPQNISTIQSRIRAACLRSERGPESVSLVAVTKNNDWISVKKAIEAGVSIIGENRVQEAVQKFPEPWDYPVERHFIGHLQKNKAKKAVKLFDCIESVDDVELLSIIDRIASEEKKTMEIMCEVNSSGESNKQGVKSKDELFRLLETATKLRHVRVRGLMTIGPLGNDHSAIRQAFASLRHLSNECSHRFDLPAWGQLSMGMSGDFEIAIEEGSTLVRIGTAIFGERQYQV